MENSLLQKNLDNFSKRFPELHKNIISHPITNPQNFGATVFNAKNNEISCMFDNTYAHSAYNPSAEAKKILQTHEIENADSVVFFGCSLGYAPIECAKKYTNKTIIIIEPNLDFLLLAFSVLDWSYVFDHESIVFLLQAPQQTVITILEQYGLNECYIIENKAFMNYDLQYYTNLQTLIKRNKSKQSINVRTLEKFSKLWLSNMCKNLSFMQKLDGINRYKNKANTLRACVLAAGPSLDEVLPYIREIKKRCILICVDTALRACLKAGVEPHFIVLVDPQYWNSLHLEGLKSPSSILITETAAYPSVFRFNCKEIILCSSHFPLGTYIETFIGEKGELVAGGSVATTAWDFARFIGCTHIYMAGLDLSFTNKKTHAKGSTFEENAYTFSNKLKPTQTELSKVLFTPLQEAAINYEGKSVISDARMKMYAWWFESKCAEYKNIQTFSLSKNALAIPGIKLETINEVLLQNECAKEIASFCELKQTKKNNQSIEEVIKLVLHSFSELQSIVDSGLLLCSKNCKNDTQYENIIKSLDEIDNEISKSVAKDIVSLVFPTPDQLQVIMDKNLPEPPPPPPIGTYSEAANYAILKSKLLYETIKKSIVFHTQHLRKNS